MNSTARVVLFAAEQAQGLRIAGWLEMANYSVIRIGMIDLADEVLRRERPDIVVASPVELGDRVAVSKIGRTAQSLKIPALALVEPGPDLVARVKDFDDWVTIDRAEQDLIQRVEWLLARPSVQSSPAVDPRFLALVVHDLRTPLNVIGLTIRAIAQSNPTNNPEFEEDLTFLQENAKQIERMLAQLGDLSRLIESEGIAAPVEFQTRRFLGDFLEEKQAKRDSEFKAVRLEYGADSPSEVCLDAIKVRLALSHALANALAAAGDTPVRIRSSGPTGSWTIEFIVDKSPPPTTTSAALRSHIFERLLGSAAERRGLDLAIASRVSELFGGSCQLDVEPGVRTSVKLVWPTRFSPDISST